MKQIILSLLCLASAVAQAQFPIQHPSETEILKAGGLPAEMMIEKAYAILDRADVFASRAVGDGGTPTSACWALTVIVKHEAGARERLTEILPRIKGPETKLYILAGLLALDPETPKRHPQSDFPKELLKKAAHTMGGCIYAKSTFEAELLTLYSEGASSYLFENLPSIYQTTDVRRFEDLVK